LERKEGMVAVRCGWWWVVMLDVRSVCWLGGAVFSIVSQADFDEYFAVRRRHLYIISKSLRIGSFEQRRSHCSQLFRTVPLCLLRMRVLCLDDLARENKAFSATTSVEKMREVSCSTCRFIKCILQVAKIYINQFSEIRQARIGNCCNFRACGRMNMMNVMAPMRTHMTLTI
jgi:hypothetical protein